MTLEVRDLACGYGGRRVVEGFSMRVGAGDVHCLLGPNGVGKTTLFKTVLGLLPRLAGSVLLDGREVDGLSAREFARAVAYVPQAHTPPFAFNVRDVVVMGRLAHLGPFAAPGRADYEAADDALAQLGIGRLADRVYTELSGGERQMALIARAVAQSPRFLMMDEPTANLDFGNQAEVLGAAKRLAAGGMGVVMTTHVPDHLFQCEAEGTLMLRDGRYVKGGADAVLTPENLRDAYGIEVMVLDASWRGRGVRFCRPVVV
ncbi:ABC transporter ATP-binding protein [Gordonibacter massiliensis (ex Traore et al. 2017)]|uniref:ABC transporter ATP-binding protein n=1 Tax=Gordonibacter massiliensis (ex Traore et al. 2017) TaxID=1841863 RepID=A0A842JH92_9ACTN|nr:ABC transporter ATP-binding protein [Gordonibacter massiliensis (ex Traore et al. 2017)]